MQIYKEGEKSKGLCEHCKKMVSTTFKLRTTNLNDENEKPFKVPNILICACDFCNHTIAIPQQSFASIAEVKNKESKQKIDVRLPRHFLDILNNTIVALGIKASSDMRGLLLRFYLASVVTNTKTINVLKKNLHSNLLNGHFKRSSRLTITMNFQLEEHFKNLIKASGLNQTEIIDSLIIEINNDVLSKQNKSKSDEVKIMLLANG